MSQLTIKNPTFAKQLEEKTKDDPIMNSFIPLSRAAMKPPSLGENTPMLLIKQLFR